MNNVENSNANIIKNIASTVNGKTPDSSKPKNDLGKDAFLNLLVTQMRYQDPLNPTSDKDFLAQMAQFSALEQAQNMNSTVSQSKAFSLIGKAVEGTVKDESTNELQWVEGIVDSVKIVDGNVTLTVSGDKGVKKDIKLDNVTKVIETAPAADVVLIDQIIELTKTVDELKDIIAKYAGEDIGDGSGEDTGEGSGEDKPTEK